MVETGSKNADNYCGHDYQVLALDANSERPIMACSVPAILSLDSDQSASLL